jgi:hypothetical protein
LVLPYPPYASGGAGLEGSQQSWGAVLLGEEDQGGSQQPPPWVPKGRIGSSPAKLSPEEGVRLMRAFIRIRHQGLREIVIRLAASLAEAENGENQ